MIYDTDMEKIKRAFVSALCNVHICVTCLLLAVKTIE